MTATENQVVPTVSVPESDLRARVADVRAARARAAAGPSRAATEAQRARGKLTARERMELGVVRLE